MATRLNKARLLPITSLLACLLSGIVIGVQWLLFPALSGYQSGELGRQHVEALQVLQNQLRQCVETNGLGLSAEVKTHCKIVLKYPESTNSTWYNDQFKFYEPLEYGFDVCESLLLWEQYRNVTTILTREYLDARPDGWLDYAAKRISQLSLCEEELQLVLPAEPPFKPHQFATCAVVGNSGDLLLTEFGPDIDSHDAVIRDNEAPVNKKYARNIGMKRDFRLVGGGVARNLLKVVNGSADEVLIIKSKIHRDFNAMIKQIPNPVYLFQGVVFRRGAKGTGVKSIELALSMCDSVDIYGFTVDPGYTEWTRYFSEPRKGHNPLQGRAYYQLLECLGILKIHSPMREQHKQDWSVIPSRPSLVAAHTAAMHFRQQPGTHPDSFGPFSACRVWATVVLEKGRLSGSHDMSALRQQSNYSKWEQLGINDLRRQAQSHHTASKGISLYKIDGNKLENLLCVKSSNDTNTLPGLPAIAV